MNKIQELSKQIKEKRLSLNMTMDNVAKKAHITRATLSSIENGSGKCSINNLIEVLNVLDMDINIDGNKDKTSKRSRATRTNTLLDKKINQFIVMCVEQYASSVNKRSDIVYKQMNKKHIIDDLINDYEDLHGMSTAYLNNYINTLLGKGKTDNQNLNDSDNNVVVKTILIYEVIEIIAAKEKLTIKEARNNFYNSRIIKLLEDDSTGLFGCSPFYIFSYYLKEKR